MSWHRKHLLDIESLTAEELTAVLDTAREFKAVGERDIKKVPALQGKTVVNFFVEPSTRTRVSFELSAKRLNDAAFVLANYSATSHGLPNVVAAAAAAPPEGLAPRRRRLERAGAHGEEEQRDHAHRAGC